MCIRDREKAGALDPNWTKTEVKTYSCGRSSTKYWFWLWGLVELRRSLSPKLISVAVFYFNPSLANASEPPPWVCNFFGRWPEPPDSRLAFLQDSRWSSAFSSVWYIKKEHISGHDIKGKGRSLPGLSYSARCWPNGSAPNQERGESQKPRKMTDPG